MATRTTTTKVTFRRPFVITGLADLQAPGDYDVDTEEEQIEGISFPAWKRVATAIQLSRAGAIEHVAIEPDELHEALMRDGAQEHPAHPSSLSAMKTRRHTARNRLVTRKKF